MFLLLCFLLYVITLVDRKIESLQLMKNLEDGHPRDLDQDDNRDIFIYVKLFQASVVWSWTFCS